MVGAGRPARQSAIFEPHTGRVGRVPVSRDDAAAGGTVTIPLPTAPGVSLAHTFPDTRHREVGYIPKVINRFPASARPQPPGAGLRDPLFV